MPGRPPLSLLRSALLGLAGCAPPHTGGVDGGSPTGAFQSPQGVAATSRYVLVVSSAFHFEQGRPSYAPGWLTVIERSSRRLVGRLPLSGVNPQHLAVAGARAYVVSSGALSLDGAGLGTAAGDGALDLFDFAAGLPAGPAATLRLPRSGSDPRIGAHDRIALSADGRRAFLGSGTRGDLFVVELEGELRLARGPDDPLALFHTPPGKNGLTAPVWLGERLGVLDFNSDALCLIADPSGALADRRCHPVGAYPELLEGPIDLAAGAAGELLVLMSVAGGLYRVDPTAEPFGVQPTFARTGLAPNRVRVHQGKAYVVNSLSNNLQRIELAGGRSELPFAVLPVGSDPYDLCITEEKEGLRGWVTLQASNQLAEVDLQSGTVLELLSGQTTPDDARAGDGRDARPAEARPPCPDGGAPTVGISSVAKLQLGEGGGAGEEALPGVIQGPPGGPGSRGETLSLGVGGELIVDFGDYDIVDGPGPDFIVFENPFLLGPYQPYAEPAVVGLSASDLAAPSFVDFPCDLSQASGDPQQQRWPYPGCAGVHPALAGKGSCITPSDAAAAGGDTFDLAAVGLSRARYLRLRDAGLSPMGEASKGFDLDAVVLIHYSKR